MTNVNWLNAKNEVGQGFLANSFAAEYIEESFLLPPAIHVINIATNNPRIVYRSNVIDFPEAPAANKRPAKISALFWQDTPALPEYREPVFAPTCFDTRITSAYSPNLPLSVKGVWSGPLSNLIQELARIPDGWAGLNTVGPSNSVVQDMLYLDASLPVAVSIPEAEVDPDDGYVSLRWLDLDSRNCVTLTLFGSHRMIVSFSSLNGHDKPSREVNVRNKGEVISILSAEDFERVLTTNALPR